MSHIQRDGSDESGCCHWTEAGLRAEVREQVAREIEAYAAKDSPFLLIAAAFNIAAKIARGK